MKKNNQNAKKDKVKDDFIGFKTYPELKEKIKALVGKRGVSVFVTEAIDEKIERDKKE